MTIKEAINSSQVFRVIGSVNLLLEEVFRLTSKAPKKFRFSICKKMDDIAMEIVRNVYQANDSFVSGYDKKVVLRNRLSLELEALSKVKLLGNIAKISVEIQCISKGEYGVLAKLLSDSQKLLGAWYKSDRIRLEKIQPNDV